MKRLPTEVTRGSWCRVVLRQLQKRRLRATAALRSGEPRGRERGVRCLRHSSASEADAAVHAEELLRTLVLLRRERVHTVIIRVVHLQGGRLGRWL